MIEYAREMAFDFYPNADGLMIESSDYNVCRCAECSGNYYEREFKLSGESARRLAFSAELGEYFEHALDARAEPAPPPQSLANWVGGELAARLEEEQDPASSRVTPAALAGLVGMLAAKRLSVGAARQVLDTLVHDGGDPAANGGSRPDAG